MAKYRVQQPILIVDDGNTVVRSYATGTTIDLTAEEAATYGEAVLRIGFGTVFPVNPDDNFAVRVEVPETPTTEGQIGEWAASNTYFYVCVAENTWRRCSLSTWS